MSLYGAFLDLAQIMRAELLEQLSKLTIVTDIFDVKCWYAIPGEVVTLTKREDTADKQQLKEKMNGFNKQAIKDKKHHFIKTLVGFWQEFETQVIKLHEMEVITHLFDC